MMNYFLLDFNYGGTFDDTSNEVPEIDDEHRLLRQAEKKVEEILAKHFEWIHAYSWPDGSLYKYIRTKLSQIEVEELFDQELDETKIDMISIPRSKDYIGPGNKSTLEEGFDLKYK